MNASTTSMLRQGIDADSCQIESDLAVLSKEVVDVPVEQHIEQVVHVPVVLCLVLGRSNRIGSNRIP